ncbi:MAG: hypothetical protein ACE5EU_02575 [Paracoccaceae bacterium]
MAIILQSRADPAKDWARSPSRYLVAWGIPSVVLVAAGLLEPGPRALVWASVLVWMGSACLVNARRCGRTHCRYTGPYNLLMIVPVALLGAGVVSFGAWAWWALGAMILLGTKVIWLVTEQLWGRYRK